MLLGVDLDGFIDAFYEVPRQGVCIFRLFEIIHQFNGQAIWWIPLQTPLTPTQINSIEDYVLSEHIKSDPFSFPLSGVCVDFLRETFNVSVKNKYSLCDFYNPYFIATALK